MSRKSSVLSALVAVNKPVGLTSFDVVACVRRYVGERRVGHAGTLDPLASGVLIVGIGQATKLLGMLTLDRKSYRATICLGSETQTDDREGDITATTSVPSQLFEWAVAEQAVHALEGTFEQVPPAYSAVSVDGKRAYALARSGQTPHLKARTVTVFRARLVEVVPEKQAWIVDLDVSKGTYIRSIARDLGRSLGCYAHVAELVRTRAGSVDLETCVDLNSFERGGVSFVHAHCLDPLETLGLARRQLDITDLSAVSNGRPITVGQVEDTYMTYPRSCVPERVGLVWDAALVGIWEQKNNQLVCDHNFPRAIEGVQPTLARVAPDTPLSVAAQSRLVREALGEPTFPISYRTYNFCVCDGAVSGRILVSHETSQEQITLWDMTKHPVCACAIGAFDGMHRGHKALLERARREAQGAKACLAAVCFSPDPAVVLSDISEGCDLLSIKDRVWKLLGLGADFVIIFDFTPKLAMLSYQRFVCEALGSLVQISSLVVGSDFRLGAGGIGTVEALSALGHREGFDVIGMQLADFDGAPISASRIRALLAQGKIDVAAALLGRCHFVRGKVIHGRGEGTSFGFPTANVAVFPQLCLPAEGVYAGFVVITHNYAKRAWPAAINVGKPRTFEPEVSHQAFLEATLVGFSGDLYGDEVAVVFTHWLREPRKFESQEELETTVLGNIAWVRQSFGGKAPVLIREDA